VEVALHDSYKSLFELLIGKSVAKWVDGRVGVAEKVCKHVDVGIDATAKAFHHCKLKRQSIFKYKEDRNFGNTTLISFSRKVFFRIKLFILVAFKSVEIFFWERTPSDYMQGATNISCVRHNFSSR